MVISFSSGIGAHSLDGPRSRADGARSLDGPRSRADEPRSVAGHQKNGILPFNFALRYRA